MSVQESQNIFSRSQDLQVELEKLKALTPKHKEHNEAIDFIQKSIDDLMLEIQENKNEGIPTGVQEKFLGQLRNRLNTKKEESAKILESKKKKFITERELFKIKVLSTYINSNVNSLKTEIYCLLKDYFNFTPVQIKTEIQTRIDKEEQEKNAVNVVNDKLVTFHICNSKYALKRTKNGVVRIPMNPEDTALVISCDVQFIPQKTTIEIAATPAEKERRQRLEERTRQRDRSDFGKEMQTNKHDSGDQVRRLSEPKQSMSIRKPNLSFADALRK